MQSLYRTLNLIDSVFKDCKNIVESVHYNIFHSGVEGINAIDAFIKLTNLTKPNFHQTFSYRSFWSQDNKTTTSPRSGNPGYLVGKPVLSGSMNTSTAGEYFIDDQVEAGRKLTLFVPGSSGKCDFNARAARSPILFGENVKLGCSVYLNRTEISQSCASLKNKSFQMLNGVQFQHMTETYVATFGNSQPNQTWDWVKVSNESFADIFFSSHKQRGLFIDLGKKGRKTSIFKIFDRECDENCIPVFEMHCQC